MFRKASRIVYDLADELRSERSFGQPRIDEEEQSITGRIRVLALWDRWSGMSHEERSSTILRAYREVEGKEFADRITLATGLTFPEAAVSGFLPLQIIPALRPGDPVTLDQCHRAMIDEGGSILQDPGRPQLRFADEDEAEAARERLSDRLPGSEPVWQILREVGANHDLAWDVSG